jgi:hypothetical protein
LALLRWWAAKPGAAIAAVAALTVVPTYLIYFAVRTLPGALVGKQIVFDAIGLLVFGIVVAWLYRPRAAG